MHYKLFFHAVIFFTAFTFNQLRAQQMISGTVTDGQTGAPLIGAEIIIAGTSSGTITGVLGEFSIEVTQHVSAIKVSYMGYKSQLVDNPTIKMNITLEPSFSTLEQVVISANREKELRSEVPAAISTISPRVLQEADANTLDQVLNKVPGVFVADLANEQHMTSIRQPISTKGLYLFLEDGLPTRPTGVFNHNAMNELNQGAIERIEVIRGPASSTYGAEAIGGVINVITASPTVNLSGTLALRATSNGLRRTDFRMSNTYNKTGIFIGGYYSRRRNGFFEHSDMDKYAGTIKVTHAFSHKTDMNFSLTYADLVTDMTGNLDSAGFFGNDLSSNQTFTERKVNALRIQSTLSHDWNKNAYTAARLFFRDNLIGQIPSYRIRTDKTSGKTSGTINVRTFQSYGALIQHTQKFDPLSTKIIAGVSLDHSPTAFVEDYILVDQNDEGVNIGYAAVDSSLTKNTVALTNFGAYATWQFNPVEKLRLSASVRYDHFHYTHNNLLPPSAFSGSPDAISDFDAVTPKIGLTYDFSNKSGTYTNFSQGFVPPQITELYRGVTIPHLAPSVYNNYEIGGWYGFRILDKITGHANVAFYHVKATNQIISVQLEDGTRENQNAGETKSQGIEYKLGLNYMQQVQFRWSGSFARHVFVDYIENGRKLNGNEMAQGANVQFNWELTYRPSFLSGFRISVENQYLGPYWMDNENTRTYRGFSLFNIRAGYEIKKITVAITLHNITDKLWSPYVISSGYGVSYTPGMPRTYQIKLGYSL